MSDPSSPNSLTGHPLSGRLLAGRYLLGKLIGQGGMGSVYQAHDQQMSNRVVAIKILALHLVGDDKQVARFEQEARAANQLGHPNTISVLDFGQSDGLLYMVMEYLTGETLTQVLRRSRLPVARALYMVRQVLKSLAEAHSKGIIHRDLKPDNIFVCEVYGEKDFIKVIDFGIAKFLESGGQELTQAGKMFGTPRYLSPEQAQGLPLTPASDLYALGVILFEMISGRPPFIAEDPIAVAIKHVQERPPRLSEVAAELELPEAVDEFVAHLLAKKPTHRYQSAEEVMEAVDDLLAVLGQSLSGSQRLPTGQYRQAGSPTGQVRAPGNRTPGRPVTVPPVSRITGPGATVGLAGESDATQALETVPLAAGNRLSPTEPAPDGRTRSLSPTPAAAAVLQVAAGQSTLALSTEDIAAHRAAAESNKETSAAPGRPAQVPAATPAASTPPVDGGARSGAGRWIAVLAGFGIAVGASAWLTAGYRQPNAPQDGSTATGEALAAGDVIEAGDVAQDDAPLALAVAAPAGDATSTAEPTPAAPVVLPAPTTAAAAVAKPTDDILMLQLDSDPPGALVIIDGIDLGPAPRKLQLRKGVVQKVVLRLDGYLDESLETDKLYNVAMLMPDPKVKQKLRPKPAVKPTRKPGTPKKEIEW
jgi:serine/threonine-protein kinase